MSVPATEGQEPIIDSQGSEVIELPVHGDAAFGALMDALAPEPDDAGGSGGTAGADAEAGAAAPGAAADNGAAAGGGEGAAAAAGGPAAAGTQPGAGAVDGAPAAGAGGSVDGAPAAGTAADAGGGDRPADWAQPAAELVPRFGELSTAFEENVSRAYHEEALTAVRTEHANYFTALEKHPRLLVGTQVPAIGKEGMETIRDTDDAREWQDAVKQILVEEVKGRAQKSLDDSSDFLSTVHGSIELFQNNTDLIPGTAEFDTELANRFAEFAAPYELRVEEKLQGYSIPVQPLIERIRAQLVAERASTAATAGKSAAPAAAAAGAPAAAPSSGTPAQTQAKPPEPPQAGIPSKAGNSDSSEDFSTLFGTIGLPNLQI